MMTTEQIKSATREDLAAELGAGGEYTQDWRTADIEDLRERVRLLVAQFQRTTGRK